MKCSAELGIAKFPDTPGHATYAPRRLTINKMPRYSNTLVTMGLGPPGSARTWGSVVPCTSASSIAPRDPEDVGGHRGQLDPSVLQQLVQAVGRSLPFLDQDLAVAVSSPAAPGSGPVARSSPAAAHAPAVARSRYSPAHRSSVPGTCLMWPALTSRQVKAVSSRTPAAQPAPRQDGNDAAGRVDVRSAQARRSSRRAAGSKGRRRQDADR
jgi:hypothetical protein